jgi:hypothetical protein
MTPSWLLDLLAAIMLVVAAVSVIRLLAGALAAGRPWRPVRTGADADVAHALMGIAMAGMFTTSLTTLPGTGWAVIFGLATAWFAWRTWLDARGARALLAHRCTLHVVHCAAMLYAFLALNAPAAGMGGMPGMGGVAMRTVEYPTLAGVFVATLIGYCAWDLDQLSARRYSLAGAGGGVAAGSAPRVVVSGRGPAARSVLVAPGTKIGLDVILGVAMALMLVIMI